MNVCPSTRHVLFGGERGWNSDDWVASDDRVRGGRSHSYLKITDNRATFCGHLDIETLGGAGFASQRTVGDDSHWDLSGFDALELLIDPTASDDKRYTFNLKDEVLPRNPENGREQSTTSWEYDFHLDERAPDQETQSGLKTITIPWADFTPTYRGRKIQPARPLNLVDIRTVSIMMRSFFGGQKGDFSLCIVSVSAVHLSQTLNPGDRDPTSDSSTVSSVRDLKMSQPELPEKAPTSVWTRLLSMCNRL